MSANNTSPYREATGTVRDRGIVKAWKGSFGFIKPSDGSPDVFAYFSDIQGQGFKQLVEGETVEYDVEPGAKGPKAVRIVRLGATT